MTNEQKTALRLLLKRYGQLFFETSVAPTSRYGDAFHEEQMAEEEIISFVDAMLTSASKEAATTVLDKSFWGG